MLFVTFFKLDYFFPKYSIFLHAVNIYLLADLVLDTNNQFAKVSILVTININLDSHERRVVARNVTISTKVVDYMSHYWTNVFKVTQRGSF